MAFEKINENIISELKWRKGENDKGMQLPVPVYLFIRNYGREPYDSIEEIAGLYGDKDSLFFNAASKLERSLISAFLLETQKHKSMGMEFSGFVHIELSDEIEESEYKQFFRYLLEKQDQYHYLFSVDSDCDADFFQSLLEQFFFVRRKDGKKYSIKEQLVIVSKLLENQNIKLPDNIINEIEDKLSCYSWSLGENVKNKIESIINNGIYNYTMNKNFNNEDSFLQAFDRLKAAQSFKMGFACVEK